MSDELKRAIKNHWEQQPCGTRGIEAPDRRRFFRQLEADRYEQDRHIAEFAQFHQGRDRDVLEIGVGAGTDFVNWIRCGARATGVDLTESSVELTRERLELEGLPGRVVRADAEDLPFPDDSFDIVYSYGVLHHTPDTARAIEEVHRVLRPGGIARLMIYRVPSWTGYLLWGYHSAARLRPWQSPRSAIFNHLESPGTKAYTETEARHLLRQFSIVNITAAVLAGDLLAMKPSDKYTRPLHRLLFRVYPRRTIRRFGRRLGLAMLIEARKEHR